MRTTVVFLMMILTGCLWVPTRQEARQAAPAPREADLCVYGATPAGLLAAVAAARQGCSVIIVEPSRWLGGIIGAGIRITRDCEHPGDIGGLTAAMIRADENFGIADDLRAQKETRALWARLVRKNKIPVLYEHRLGAVEKQGRRLGALRLDYAPPERDGCPIAQPLRRDAVRVSARMFIDASYEGDLMAQAGVRYAVGRESAAQYGESLGGVRNFRVFNGVDPYVKPGDPASGLLPLLAPEPPGTPGEASRYPMTYNFRFIVKGPDALPPLAAPDRPDPVLAELFKRTGGKAGWPTDNYSRGSLISGGPTGAHADYADGDWPTRARIWRAYIEYVKNLSRLTGRAPYLDPAEYPDTGGWPHQLYIRVARRMLGRTVMTQADLAHQTKAAEDSIGLGYYCVDIYPCRLTVAPDGKNVATEGEVWELVCPGPFRIPYRAITPKAGECENLLVPVCMSASHVAYSVIRMEPTYMVMGESAGIAAALALRENSSVQGLDAGRLQQALRAAGQILEWDGKGYGSSFWNKPFVGWWEKHPEEYRKNPPAPAP